MKTKHLIVCLLSLAVLPYDAGANSMTNVRACSPCMGRYSGRISEHHNFFGRPESVSVIIANEEVYVGIMADGGGAFDASSDKFTCSGGRLRGVLDTGVAGLGKISIVIRRNKRMYLRLYGYEQGEGPNKAGYLPPEKLEIPLKKER